MKKLISVLLITLIILSNVPVVLAAPRGTMSNFFAVREYSSGHFTDVSDSDWYSENVKMAYEYDLISGTSDTTFSPDSDQTIAETITIASRIHNAYYKEDHVFKSNSQKWYMPYVKYAINKNIISPAQFLDFDEKVTRLQFVTIMSKALPESEFEPVNNFEYGDIPDLNNDKNVYLFYNAGILSGNDENGTFNPQALIKRSETCAIITRMIDKSLRKQGSQREINKTFMGDTIYKFFYKIQGDTAIVVSKYGECQDIVTTLKCRGGNKLFDFSEFAIMSNESKQPYYDIRKAKVFNESSSDWHAPFFVRAKENIDGDDIESPHFTGGNHEYTNKGIGGTPTARTTKISFKIDNAIVKNRDGYGNKLEISWTNLVQAANTKKLDGSGREVLEENHTLVFDGEVWREHIELIPLEDVTMFTWYGFQCMGTSSIYKNNLFIGDFETDSDGKALDIPSSVLDNITDSAGVIYVDGTTGGDCGNNKAAKFIGYGNEHQVEIGIDPTFGLGKREMYKGTQGLFSTSYDKAYFWIIENTDLEKDASYELKGYYKFTPVK